MIAGITPGFMVVAHFALSSPGARSVLLASRMAIQLDCFVVPQSALLASRVAMTNCTTTGFFREAVILRV
jgi:hypothetical protein